MRAARAIFFILLLSFGRAGYGYQIKGRIAHYSPRWAAKIYLAIIPSINQFNITSPGMMVSEAGLDKDGNFILTGNNLPEAYTFYRIYLSDHEGTAAYNAVKNSQNFLHLPLNNSSNVGIDVDLAVGAIYTAKIEGVHNAAFYTRFYSEIFYMQGNARAASGSQEKLNSDKQVRLIFKSIEHARDNLYTVFAIANLDWDYAYGNYRDELKRAIEQLDKTGVNPVYLKELNERLEKYDTKNSWVYGFVSYRSVTVLLVIIVFLAAVITALSIYIVAQRRRLSRKAKPFAAETLTPKEKEIIALIKQGYSNKEISAKLFIEVSTVKSHIGNIYQKFEIQNRKQLDQFDIS